MQWFPILAAIICQLTISTLSLSAENFLPLKTTFVGQQKFQQICLLAERENWRQLEIGERMVRVGRQLEGTPYVAYTLEIDDHIESPSVNFNGLDCWTFFETCLAFSKMLETKKSSYTPKDLLAQIEHTRYFSGRCRGNYLDRIHYLADWFDDNQKRRNINDITNKFPTVVMPNQCDEMSKLWKYYRYLKHNPELRAGMAKHEKRVTQMKVRMIPKDKVRAIESQLKNGDIIGIARHGNGSYCSHVGIVVKDSKGRARLMHASSDYKKVIIDQPLSDYLNRYKKHAGILIARPK